MKMLHTRTIKSLETVPISIAEFELQIKEYVECGGIEPTNEENKSDLLRILPEHLQDNILWRATDPGPYTQFRDMIKAQAARTLLNRRRLPIHTVAEASPPSQDDEMHEELMAVMKKFNFRNAKRQPPRQPGILRQQRQQHGHPGFAPTAAALIQRPDARTLTLTEARGLVGRARSLGTRTRTVRREQRSPSRASTQKSSTTSAGSACARALHRSPQDSKQLRGHSGSLVSPLRSEPLLVTLYTSTVTRH